MMVFGMAGLAIDVGRMYITKNEAQSFADSAALYGALQLDGSAQGLTNADNAITNCPLKWNFATSSFSGTVVEYSANGLTGWAKSSDVPSSTKKDMRYVRVSPTVTLPLLFLPATGPFTGIGLSANVKAQAVGGQVLKSTFATVESSRSLR